jgi:hypothetical protein
VTTRKMVVAVNALRFDSARGGACEPYFGSVSKKKCFWCDRCELFEEHLHLKEGPFFELYELIQILILLKKHYLPIIYISGSRSLSHFC